DDGSRVDPRQRTDRRTGRAGLPDADGRALPACGTAYMTLDEFWNLIDGTRLPDGREHASRLTQVLSERSLDDIFAFAERWAKLHRAAHRWDLWGAAYLIGGGCSDDSFIDFRSGLILRGKQVYEAAIADPDNLADVANLA